MVRSARLLAATRTVQVIARAGFLAKTALYGLVAEAAFRAALRDPDATTDPKGALFALGRGLHGDVAAGLVAAAIGALGLWFVLEAIANPFRQPRTAWSAVARVGQAIGGLGYVALAIAGLHFANGGGEGPTGDALARGFASRVLAHATGAVAITVVGFTVIGIGARQLRFGASGQCLSALDLSGRPPRLRRAARLAGALGFATQGLLFALVGVFLVQAAWEGQPAEATGTAGVLTVLTRPPWGPSFLLAATAGLVAYALFAGLEGAFRRFPARPRRPGSA